MTCNEARQHWMLYLDSEGDAELHFRISDHLGMCPDCAEWFAKQERLERLLADRLKCDEANDELWGRVLQRTGLVPTRRPGGWRKTVWSLAGAVAVLGLAFIAATLLLTRPAAEPVVAVPDLARLTTDCHERHLRGLSQVEFHSQDDQAIERYIRQQVSFPVHCPPRKNVDFAVEGAGVCRWAPKPMVYLVGRVEETSVSVFVLDRACLDLFSQDRGRLDRGGGRYRCRQGGYHMVSGVTTDNVVVVVGTAPPEVLEKLLNAYGSYHKG